MRRRRRSRSLFKVTRADIKITAGLLVALFTLTMIGKVAARWTDADSRGLEEAGLLISLAALVVVAVPILIKIIHIRSLDTQTRSAVRSHLDALGRRRAQLLTRDAYGVVQSERWRAEIRHFLKHFVPKTTLRRDADRWENLVERLVSDEVAKQPVFCDYAPTMTPREFEAFCARQLEDAGWTASLTALTGDQGVDVIAVKGNVRIVLQCKQYSHPVGNKAVQEVVAAKGHEDADIAVVVSNASYTKSAQALARTNGVYLCHFSQLPDIDKIISAHGPI